jgi:hypothetical protein
MSYRGSLHFRINLSVGIAFLWFAFLILLLTFGTSLGTSVILWTLLVAGTVAGASIAYVWAEWVLRAGRS